MKRTILIMSLILSSILLFQVCDSGSTAPDTTPPAAPMGFQFDNNATSDGVISLFWSANTESDLAGYKLYRDAGPGTDYSPLGTTTNTTYKDQGLDYDTEYSYKIQAYDRSDNYSEFTVVDGERIASLNRTRPVSPSGLTIFAHNLTVLDQIDIQLTWHANSESDFARYKIYRHTSGSFLPENDYLLDSLTETSYSDFDVTIGTNYFYMIVACDNGGKSSDPSSIVKDLPLPEATLVYPINGETAVSSRPTFMWQGLAGATGYEISLSDSPLSPAIWSTKILKPTSGNPEITYPNSNQALTPGGIYYWQIGAYSIGSSIVDLTEVNSYSPIKSFKIPS